MEIVIVIVVLVIVVIVAITLVGSSLPVGHVASRTVRFRRPSEEVWAAVNDSTLVPRAGSAA